MDDNLPDWHDGYDEATAENPSIDNGWGGTVNVGDWAWKTAIGDLVLDDEDEIKKFLAYKDEAALLPLVKMRNSIEIMTGIFGAQLIEVA